MYAFHNHLYFIHGFLHRIAFAHQITGFSVSAVHAGTGNDQIPDSGKPEECFRTGTHCDTQTAYFSDSPRYQSRLCIISVSHTISHTGGQCNYIFQRSTQFDSENIRAGIYPEDGTHEYFLKIFCCFLFSCTDHAGGWKTSSHFFRMTWPGKNCHIHTRNLLFNNLAHGKKCLSLHTFCHIDDHLIFTDKRTHFTCRASDCRRRNGQYQNILPIHSSLKICGDQQIILQFYTGKFRTIFPVCLKGKCLIFPI